MAGSGHTRDIAWPRFWAKAFCNIRCEHASCGTKAFFGKVANHARSSGVRNEGCGNGRLQNLFIAVHATRVPGNDICAP